MQKSGAFAQVPAASGALHCPSGKWENGAEWQVILSGPPQASSRLAMAGPAGAAVAAIAPCAQPNITTNATAAKLPRCNRNSPPEPESLSSRAFLVLPMGDQIVHHGGIRQCRGIAEAARFVLGDL